MLDRKLAKRYFMREAIKEAYDDKKFFENTIETEEVDRESCLKLFKDYTELNHTMY